MTPEQQQIAIAQACGIIKQPNAWSGVIAKTGEFCAFPNYPGSLDAMREAEKMLTDDQWDHYCELLGGSLRHCASSTAAQRAEAFLRTIGKWTE